MPRKEWDRYERTNDLAARTDRPFCRRLYGGEKGGIVSVGLTFLLTGHKRGASVTMILSGMLVSAFFSSLVALLKFTAAPQEKLPQIVYWFMGSLASVKFDGLLLILPAYLAALTLLFLYRWRINILGMGEQEAPSMDVTVRRDRAVIILAATLVTALVVSISGIIGWGGASLISRSSPIRTSRAASISSSCSRRRSRKALRFSSSTSRRHISTLATRTASWVSSCASTRRASAF